MSNAHPDLKTARSECSILVKIPLTLDVDEILLGREGRALLDEGEAGLWLVAHQPFDGGGRTFLVLGQDDDLEEGPLARVHRRFLQLRGQHFTQSLEAAGLDLALAGEE